MFRVACAIFLGAVATSCTDDNDWSVDSAFDRLFGTTADKISVETEEATPTQAKVTFSAVPDATYYIIEVSKDSLYDDVAMGGTNAIVYKAETNEGTSSTTFISTLTGLEGDTRYYLRIKSMADGKNESKWVYYKDGDSFKTKAEQIFTGVTDDDRDDSSIRLKWTAGEAVTHILQVQESDTTQINLSSEAITNGEYTVTGLSPLTSYTFIIYNGTTKRGTVTASTTAAMPAADYKYTLGADVTQLTQDILDQIAESAKAASGSSTSYSATIAIKGGQTVELSSIDASTGDVSTLVIPDGMSVTFFGLPGAKPTLTMKKSLGIDGSHAFIAFNNVKVTDNGSNYFVNQSAACTVQDFTVEDCEMSGFKNAFFRLQGSAVKEIGTLTLTNSTFDSMCSGYSFVHVDASSGKGVVKNIAMENCTFSNIAASNGKMFVYSKLTNMESLTINYCTFYNITSNGNYFVDFGDADHGATKFEISNSLFGKTGDEATNKNIRSSVTPTVWDVYTATDFYKKIKEATALEVSSADLFADPANGDFTVKLDDYKKFGDQRWNIAE